MNAETLHRKKLKEIGYNDNAIEELVYKYRDSAKYEFAESYHQEMIKHLTPSDEDIRLFVDDYYSDSKKSYKKTTLVSVSTAFAK